MWTFVNVDELRNSEEAREALAAKHRAVIAFKANTSVAARCRQKVDLV